MNETPYLADFGMSEMNVPVKRDWNFIPQSEMFLAPEIDIAADEEYGHGVDIWSYGCVVARLLTGIDLQRVNIADPRQRRKQRLFTTMNLFDKDNVVCDKNGWDRIYSEEAFDQLFGNFSSACQDLLKNVLNPDPATRLSAFQVLEHPFFDEEFVCPEFQDDLELLGYHD